MWERHTCTDACTATVDPSGWIGSKRCFGVPMIGKEESCSLVGRRCSLNDALSNEHTQTCAHPSPQNPPTPPRGLSPLKPQQGVQKGNRTAATQQKGHGWFRRAVNSPPLSLQIHAGTSYRTWRGEIPGPRCDAKTVGLKLVQRGWRVRTEE